VYHLTTVEYSCGRWSYTKMMNLFFLKYYRKHVIASNYVRTDSVSMRPLRHNVNIMIQSNLLSHAE